MASITIKNIPDRLYQKIKESSQQIRRTRSLTQRHFLTDKEISDIKREGLA